MQENVSNASFALLGRTYLQPSPHVLATVLARTCIRPRTYLREKTIITCFPADTRNSHSQTGWQKKKDCVAIGTQSDMYV